MPRATAIRRVNTRFGCPQPEQTESALICFDFRIRIVNNPRVLQKPPFLKNALIRCRSHFHLNKLEVSTGPVADLSSIPAAHLTTIPAAVTSTKT
ncbi:hypothetical protein DPMN_020536 [Dreissena polymorpha]|uniref:Uncharacterized protein n=1 Tax=Dreissena polymorpha TaxID=45954 RepID=A0A9D4NJ21_DREPO|nr:hypothetical protein DPMN_020536 [Dreissena polymorpha]